jgi:hypothetical protein
VPRKEEKPTLMSRLADGAMAAGALVLVGGLVTAFLVVGVWALHRSLSRNTDENLVARETSVKGPAPKPADALEELKRSRPEPRPDAAAVAAAPAEVAKPVPISVKPEPKRVPEGPPSVDPSRMDAEGFVRYWLVLGPIQADKEMSGAAETAKEQIPNEAGLRPRADERVKVKGKEYAWQRYKSPEFKVDFRRAFEGQSGDDAVAYAVTYLSSDQEMTGLKLMAGSNDQCRVYLNGVRVYQHDKSRTLERDQGVADGLTLKKGVNVLVFKVVNERNAWQGCIRFMDKNGTPIRHLRLSSSPP